MRLNLDELGDQVRLSEGEPLPPEHDRYTAPSSAWSLAGLYRDHSARLKRYFNGRGAFGSAEDLVQETFVRAADRSANRADAIGHPQAYLNQIANNLLREQARFAARRSAALHISADDVDLSATDPVAQLEARDVLNRLEAAMDKMKPATREIFMAHKVHGQTYSEIAARTGKHPRSIENHIAKAVFLINRAMRRT